MSKENKDSTVSTDLGEPNFKVGHMYSFTFGGSMCPHTEPAIDARGQEFVQIEKDTFWTVLEIGQPHEHAATWRWIKLLYNEKIFWNAFPQYGKIYIDGMIEYSNEVNKVNPRGEKPPELEAEEQEALAQAK